MKVRGYLEKKQPVLFQTFSRALQEGKLAHAYLLLGEAGVPLLEVATYLAKSVLCDHPNPLADEECVTCLRIDKEEYPDFLLFDGAQESIKKENVSDIVVAFNQTPLERKGVMVYVLNEVENMTPDAANSLLKFLEEPSDGTYAFLTSRNEAKLLPTIISRCQSIKLKLAPREEVVREAIEAGTDQLDAEILSYFYNDGTLCHEKSVTNEYLSAKAALEKALEAISTSPSFARYVFETTVLSSLTSKPEIRFFFDMLSLVFVDVVAKKMGNPIALQSYGTIIEDLSVRLPHVEKTLLDIMTLRAEIETNINTGLLLTHLVSIIYKE